MSIDDLASTLVARSGVGVGDLRHLVRAVHESGASECIRCERKVAFVPGTRGWAELAKDIVAMANSGGGIIVFGIADDGRRVGLANSLVSTLDPAKITDQLRRKAPAAAVGSSYHEANYYRRTYGVLVIQPLPVPLIFDTEWSYPDDAGTPRVAIRPGVLYVRTPGRSAPGTQADLQALWQRSVEDASRQLLARIERVAALPLGAELIAVPEGDPAQGYFLRSDGRGQPVRVVEDPNAPAVRLSEVWSPDTPFASVSAEVAAQVRHWQQADTTHRVSRHALIRWWMQRDELDLSADGAEFCLLSAGDRHGYPIHWAAQLPRTRLRAVLERELAAHRYPMRQELPYIVGAFFWSERTSILEPHLEGLGGAAQAARKVIECTSGETMATRLRWVSRVDVGDHLFGVGDLLAEGSERAREVFTWLMQHELDGDITDSQRGLARQLDIAVHAP